MATPQSTPAPVVFKDVAGYPGYRVGDDGSLWKFFTGTVARPDRNPPRWKLQRTRKAQGYRFGSLTNDAGTRPFAVHRLVLEAFVGPCPEGMETCHRNGRRSDNRLENLRWDTHRANVEDTRQYGGLCMGERTPWARLTADDVREVRRLRAEGWSYRRLAKRFTVGFTTVRALLSGRSWKCVA